MTVAVGDSIEILSLNVSSFNGALPVFYSASAATCGSFCQEVCRQGLEDGKNIDAMKGLAATPSVIAANNDKPPHV